MHADFESGPEQKLAYIDLKYNGVQDTTCSQCVDASIKLKFWVQDINELLKADLKLGKARMS